MEEKRKTVKRLLSEYDDEMEALLNQRGVKFEKRLMKQEEGKPQFSEYAIDADQMSGNEFYRLSNRIKDKRQEQAYLSDIPVLSEEEFTSPDKKDLAAYRITAMNDSRFLYESAGVPHVFRIHKEQKRAFLSGRVTQQQPVSKEEIQRILTSYSDRWFNTIQNRYINVPSDELARQVRHNKAETLRRKSAASFQGDPETIKEYIALELSQNRDLIERYMNAPVNDILVFNENMPEEKIHGIVVNKNGTRESHRAEFVLMKIYRPKYQGFRLVAAYPI